MASRYQSVKSQNPLSFSGKPNSENSQKPQLCANHNTAYLGSYRQMSYRGPNYRRPTDANFVTTANTCVLFLSLEYI